MSLIIVRQYFKLKSKIGNTFFSCVFYLAHPINEDEVIGYQGGANCDGYDVPSGRFWCYVSKWTLMKDKSSMFLSSYLKTWFFYEVFNAELYGAIRNLCFRRAIIGLLWSSRAPLGHSRSELAQCKHKILTVPFNSALKTT